MATYYVKNGGNDGLNGQSDANAWATINKVNSSTFSPGDTILFARGSVWRESLIKYESGNSSAPITYGSYGTGTLPQIRGDDVVTGWTAETPGTGVAGENFTDGAGSRPLAWWLMAQTSGNRTSSAGSSDALVPSASPPTRGTGPYNYYSAEFVKANSQQFNLPEANMSAAFPGKNGVANGSVTVGGWVRVDAETGGDGGIFGKDTNFELIIEGGVVIFRAFASGNGAAALSGDTGAYSEGIWRHYVGRITYNAAGAVGQKHEVVLFVNGVKKAAQFLESRNTWTTDFVVGNATFKSNFDGAVSELFIFNSALTDAQIASIYDTGLDGSRITSGRTIYYKSFASEPGAIFSNEAPLRLVTLKGDLLPNNVSPGNEFWDTATQRQYVRLPGDANPSTTTMDVALRTYPVRIQGNNWWVFQDIWVRGAQKANIFADTNNNATVRRCTLSHASENGLHIYTHTGLSTSGFDVGENLCYSNGACGITVAGQNAVSMANIRIHDNETHHNCWQPYSKESNQFAYTGGIRPIGREINNCTVEDNYVHDEGIDGNLSHGEGIWFDTVGLGCIARRNKIERTTSWGVQIEDCNAVEVYSNLVINTLYYPGIAIVRNCDNNKVYNNTLINCQGGLNTDNTNGSHFSGNQFYNNIVYASSGWQIVANNGTAGSTASTFTKNLFGPNRTNFISVNGTQYSTLAAWESAWGGAASGSIQTNPTFVNEAGGDYHLAAGSAGIAAGTAITSGTLDYSKLAFNAATPTVGAYEAGASVSQVSGSITAKKPTITATATQTFPARSISGSITAKKPTITASATHTFPPHSISAGLQAKKPTLTATATTSAPINDRQITAAMVVKKPTLSATVGQTFPARSITVAITAKKPTIVGTLGLTFPARSVTAALASKKPLLSGTMVRVAAAPPARTVTATLTAPRPTLKVTLNSSRIVTHSRAPLWRTVNAGNGSTAGSWQAPLDPHALLDFTVSWADEMSTGDSILTSFLMLDGQAAAAGLTIHAESHDDDSVTSWLKVDPAFQGSLAWDGPGEVHRISFRVATLMGRIHDRTISVTVRNT